MAVAGAGAGALTLLDELAIMLERAQLTEKMSMYRDHLVGAICALPVWRAERPG